MTDSSGTCTLLYAEMVAPDCAALYGPDGKLVQEFIADGDYAWIAYRDHDCDALVIKEVWDGAITVSHYCYEYGTYELDYEWPDVLGDWVDEQMPEELQP